MIRRFNYTKRRRIPQNRVEIDVKATRDAPTFDARLNLTDLELPPNGKVFVEAYYKSSYQRFNYGTVAALSVPADRSLGEIDRGNTVLFRVKVVDAEETLGRIVAEVDDISGDDAGGGEAGRYCILPVNFRDLGEEIWRVALDGSRPVLEVNKIPNAEAFVRSDPLFIGLVYPEAIRQILRSVLMDSEWEGGDGLSGWREMWIRFARTFTPDDPPGGESEDLEREQWVGDVIRGFCEKFQLRTRLVAAREPEGA